MTSVSVSASMTLSETQEREKATFGSGGIATSTHLQHTYRFVHRPVQKAGVGLCFVLDQQHLGFGSSGCDDPRPVWSSWPGP